ncbi:LysR family transcriptional regulator [Candidimonas nitroreducens]|uniref:LysR family transcriptional regulator n=1 Tax=Candidimonas nitroreducens TaxID=683354 RepID=A0A225MX12_9BURK|nr:LysR family transcriptional regulator [Candidimonas nitroreducens]OWT64111.1 LysR family transcriptional regulator [Candidimonas nitroreducens]
MEIRQLEAFAAVLSTGSVTAAGRLLDRSQPVISRQVQELEHELGFTLFERTRPAVTLTEQGRQFHEEMQHVLAGLQQLDQRSREIALGRARPLKIVATYALGAGLLPGALAEAEAAAGAAPATSPTQATSPTRAARAAVAPGLLAGRKILVDSLAPEHVAKTIATGQAALGLSSLPIDLRRCRLHWSGEAPCVLALPESHPLAARASVAIAELRDMPVITMSSRNRLRHRLSTALFGRGAAPVRRHIETNSTLNALALVRAGLGVALVEPFTGYGMPLSGVVLRPMDAAVPFVMGVITHEDQAPDAAVSALIETLKHQAELYIPGFRLNSANRNRALLNSHHESAIEDIALL